MLISVIVPTYRNTKEEIERCLKSIYQDRFTDFEVFLADDGNTAEYAAYLDTLAVRFARLRILHLPHGGVSAARNAAIAEANGDYIILVDADDELTVQFWEDVKEISARGIKADIIYGMIPNSMGYIGSDKESAPHSFWELTEEEKQELYAVFIGMKRIRFWLEDGHISRGPVARLVRKELAKKSPFRTNLALCEDIIWNLDLLCDNPDVFVSDYVWYRIAQNPESAARRYREDRIERLREFLYVLRSYKTKETETGYRQMVFECIRDVGVNYYLLPQNPLPWFQKVRAFNRVIYSEPFCDAYKLSVKSDGVKDRLKITLSKMGLLLYVYKLKMLLRK